MLCILIALWAYYFAEMVLHVGQVPMLVYSNKAVTTYTLIEKSSQNYSNRTIIDNEMWLLHAMPACSFIYTSL